MKYSITWCNQSEANLIWGALYFWSPCCAAMRVIGHDHNGSTMLSMVGARKVRVSKEGVAAFNSQWPGSELRSTRAYWFEFDSDGDLIDTDVPEQDDGEAANAMCADCKAYLFDDILPDWA